jgi:hypothetical protein
LAPKAKVESARVKNLAHREPPPEHKFLAVFPRPTVQGIRRVPVLVDANGLPFIRYKKPQPENVSRMLRQKLEQRQKLWNHLHNLESYFLPLAEYEDKWDAIVERNTGKKLDGVDREATFWNEMKAAKISTQELMRKEVTKQKDRVQVMTNIILKERELAALERDERRKLAREKRELNNED